MSETRLRWDTYRDLFRRIRAELPGFWAEVAELGRVHQQEVVTTRGAVVQEFPATREVATQSPPEWDRSPARGADAGARGAAGGVWRGMRA